MTAGRRLLDVKGATLMGKRGFRIKQFSGLLLAALLAAIATPAASANADSMTNSSASFPGPRYEFSTARLGQYVYIFGGFQYDPITGSTNRTDEIDRYDPVNDTLTVMNGRLPIPLADTSAASDGTNIYIFDGDYASNGVGLSNGTIKYDPALDTTSIVPNGSFGQPRAYSMAFWSGQYIYVIGGVDGGGTIRNEIFTFDPATNTETFPFTLPVGLANAGIVWTGTDAYLFGGEMGAVPGWSSNVFRFNPSTGATMMKAQIRSPRGYVSAVYDGRYAWLFGGYNPSGVGQTGATNQILRYDPTADFLATSPVTLPSAGSGTAAWDGTKADLMGFSGSPSSIYRFQPSAPNDLAGAPTGVSGAPSGANQIHLSWTAPASVGSSPISSYEVFRGAMPGAEQEYANTPSLSYDDFGVQAGTTYYYRVVAINGSGEGSPSSEISILAKTVPSYPRSPSATRGPGLGQISLSWSAPTSDGGYPVTGYRLWRGTSSGSEALVRNVGNVTSYVDSGLQPGTTYFYFIDASNQLGNGTPSAEVSATTVAGPSAPPTLTAMFGSTGGTIKLSWTTPTDDGGAAIKGYLIYRGSAPDQVTLVAQVGVVLSYTDSKLKKDTVYFYRVAATNGIPGAQSMFACARPYPSKAGC